MILALRGKTTKVNTNNSNYKNILDLIALNEAKREIL